MARQVAEVVVPTARARAPHRAIEIERVEDEASLDRIKPEWNELLRASDANTPFLTWEWLHAWWGHLHAAAALRVLCVRAAGRLIAVAPLVVCRRPPAWLPVCEFLGTGDAGSDYLDVIVRRGSEPEALEALADALDADGDALRLDHVPSSSASQQLVDRLASRGWRALRLPGGRCPVIGLAGHTWDSYLATLGPAHRANVRRRVRAAERTFELRFARVGTDAERRDALTALVAFHDRRFRTHGSTAFRTPALRAFHEEATRHALHRDWLRMYVLRLNEAPAAVMYSLSYAGGFFFYQHGFDDRYERHSIGLVLMAHTIRAALEEGAQTFDMLWGTESYKWLWARQANELQQIHLFPGDVGGRIQHGAVIARRGVARAVRRAFNQGSDA
jgi:CelD/BcsL family acetyltransferase involved in cellulose biosynthesis